jgi:hypothetical protein
VFVLASGIAGTFVRDATVTVDNGGTEIVGVHGWKRVFDGKLNCRWFGAKGDGATDDTTAIQTALSLYAETGGRAAVYLPAGKYKITAGLTLPEHVVLEGDTSDRYQGGSPGTEIAYYGIDASTAITCSTASAADWSKGGIRNIRVQNYTMTTSGIGVRVRNGTNNAFLDNVHVASFPSRQVYVYEASPPVVPSTPSSFLINNCFFSGGVVPLEIMRGVEAISVNDTICGTDTTTTQGVLVSENANDTLAGQRCAITFKSCIVEISPTAPLSCVGFDWVPDIAITFIGCSVQRNSGTGTQAAFRYTNASRKMPTVEFINCTSWRMASCFNAVSAGFTIGNPSGGATIPKSFSWHRSSQAESAFVFVKQDVAAGAAGSGVPFANLVGIVESAGLVMPRPGIIAGMSARVNAAITAGTITAKVSVNGAGAPRSVVLDSASQQKFSHIDNDNDATAAMLFNAGDRIGVFHDSAAGLTPAGSLDLTVVVYIQFLP